MALPSSMEDKRAALKAAEENTEQKPIEPPKPTDSPVNKPEGESVTISRAEFNKLQAASDSVKATEARALAQANDLTALTQRLTELEEAAKASPKPAAAASPGQLGELVTEQLTEESLKDFDEDSVKLMQKIAQNAVAAAVNPLLKKIEAALGDITNNVTSAKQTVAQVSQNSFVNKVQDKLASLGTDVNTMVHSEFWPAFLQATDAASGLTYGEIAMNHNNRENVDGMASVLKTFHAKYYGTAPVNAGTGYEGATPNASNSTNTKEVNESKEMLNFSDRQEAHRKYLAKEIKYEDYEVIKKKFDLADKEGRINYDK